MFRSLRKFCAEAFVRLKEGFTLLGRRAQHRARVRVRLGNALTSDDREISTVFKGRKLTISSQDPKQSLRESKWLVFTARGFKSEASAEAYGRHLKTVLEIAGLSARQGIDVGQDIPSGWVSEEWARSIGMIAPNERLFPNVHGLSIVPDDELNKFPIIEAEGVVTSDPMQLIGAVGELENASLPTTSIATSAIRVLNLALMNPDAISRMVLAVSAIEEIGQSEHWSAGQVALLQEIAIEIDNGVGKSVVSSDEREEVAAAVRRGIHRLSLRQGVIRILRTYGLSGEIKEWDRLYGIRSGIVHGTARLTEPEQAEAANQMITLCGRVVWAILKSEGVTVPTVVATHHG